VALTEGITTGLGEMSRARVMGELLVRVRVLPSGIEVPLSSLLENIKESLKSSLVQRSWEEPIAFGLNALVLDVRVKDAEGSVDELERQLSSIEGVGSVTVLGVGRFSARL